jgi:hypothetical protein
MSKGGRPRKANHIKKAQGTERKCRDTGSELAPVDDMRVTPFGNEWALSDRQQYLFSVIVGEAKKNGVLMTQFAGDFARGAQWWDRYIEADMYMRENGMWQVSGEGKGWAQKHPAFQIAQDSHKLLVEFEGRYGLSLPGYEKLGIKPNKNNPDFD